MRAWTWSLWVTVVGLMLGSGAAEASSRPMKLPADENFLQGGGVPDIISQALSMPAVQVLISEFTARGYTRWAERDTAGTLADSSMALLAFQKPGLDPSRGAPLIMVATKPLDGTPRTVVIGGMVIRNPDGSIGTVMAGTDAPEEIKIQDMSSTVPSNYIKEVDPGSAKGWAGWIVCSVSFCGACNQAGGWLWPPAIIICCVAGAILCAFIFWET